MHDRRSRYVLACVGFALPFCLLAGCSGGGAGSAPAVDAAAADGLLVALDDGMLQGDLVGGARRFLAIPYAKPPLGPLRWKAPTPNAPWKGVRHETKFVASCAQLMDQGSPASDNEDCLYLNVWAPSPVPAKAPVMVWLHGGGNFSGGAGIPIPTTTGTLWYDGQYFASKQGVVLVTLQFRLGPLGFFAHPALAGEGSPTGNQGLLDQRLAFQWVQHNIAKFGGDPGNVTIFGESAGSGDVCCHVASPGSRGLFQRAIGESGGCTMGPVTEPPAASVASQMVAYGSAVGCPAGSSQLGCLRSASIDTLLADGMQPAPGSGAPLMGGQWSFTTVIDGPGGVLPDTLRTLFDSGDIADVPYLLGSNNDEGTTFLVSAATLSSDADYMADLQMRFGNDAAAVYQLYPPSSFGGDFNAARARAVGDSNIVCGTLDTARRASAAGRKVFMYNFDVPWSIAPTLLYAGHGSEISHVFGAPYLPMPDPGSELVGQAMNAYWASFARSGDPNHADAPASWPSFQSAADKRLQLDPGWEELSDFRATECAFWRQRAGAN